jgi:NitT/TauT family transport system permease protein
MIKLSIRKEQIFPIMTIFLIFVLWEISVIIFDVPLYLIPGPISIISKFIELGGKIIKDVRVTALESLLGFILGSSLGFLLGILFEAKREIELSLMPYAIALKTVPIVALAPLLVIWLGYGILAKIVLSALICFFPVLIGTVHGLKDVNDQSKMLFKSLAATKWQTLVWLKLPNALGSIFSSLKVAIVFSVIGAIVAEFAGAKSGIGFRILISSYNIDTVTMFVYIILSAMLGMIFYAIISLLEVVYIPWRK